MVDTYKEVSLDQSGTYENIDPRQLRKFMKIQKFRESLTPTQATDIQFRLATSKWKPEERVVYKAVTEGYTDMDSLPMATGLTTERIRNALDALVHRGALRITAVTPEAV